MKTKKTDSPTNQKILSGIEEIKKALKPENTSGEKKPKNANLQSDVKSLLELCQKKFFYLISSAFFALLFSYTIYFDLYQYDRFLQKINPKTVKISEKNASISKLKAGQRTLETSLQDYTRERNDLQRKIQTLHELNAKITIHKFLNKQKIQTINCVALKEKYLDELLTLRTQEKYKNLIVMDNTLTGNYQWLYDRCQKKILLKIVDDVLFRKKNIHKMQEALLIHQSINSHLEKAEQLNLTLENKIKDINNQIGTATYHMEASKDDLEKLKKEKRDYFKNEQGVLQIIEKSASFHGVSIPRIVLMPLLPFIVLVFYAWFLIHFDRIRVIISRNAEDYTPIEFPWFVMYDTWSARILTVIAFCIPLGIACGSCYLHHYVYNNYLDTIKLLIKVFPGYVVMICSIPVVMTTIFTAWTLYIWRSCMSLKKETL